jgi:hypothetical protein
MHVASKTAVSSAPNEAERQSFLDNVVADLLANKASDYGASMTTFWVPVQPVNATLPVLKGKDAVYDETSRVFLRLHCGRETRDFGIAGSVGNSWGFKPEQKE